MPSGAAATWEASRRRPTFAKQSVQSLNGIDLSLPSFWVLWCRPTLSLNHPHAGLSIASKSIFEQIMWRGNLASQVVYEAAVAASHTPAEAEAIKKLQPFFQQLDEPTSHAWVESGLPMGPRIGVVGLPEELLRTSAKFQLPTIKRERGEVQQAEKDWREESGQQAKAK